MLKKISYLLTLTLTSAALGASHFLVMGGGGEPNKPTTLFDIELQNATNYFNKSNAQGRITFNGGHSHTEQIAGSFARKTGRANEHFTAASFEATIKDYENQINSGKIKSGDQLIVMISSHGSEKTDNNKTHWVSATSQKGGLVNYSTLEGSETVSLDRLENLTKLAKQKGINLGIMDFSCHSGLSQKLANENTCVISSTGPEHFAWGGSEVTFASNFTKLMSPGKSMEDVFLEAMKDKRETSFPMISTSLGGEIQDYVYPLISAHLHDTRSDQSKKKMIDYYNSNFEDDKCESFNQNLEDLINFTYDMENIVENTNYQKLRDLVKQYGDIQKVITNNVKAMHSRVDLKKEERFCDDAKPVRSCLRFTGSELLNLDANAMIKLLQDQEAQSRSGSGLYQNRILMYQRAKARQDQLLKDPTILAVKDYWDRSRDLVKTEALSNAIATEIQDAYVRSYKGLRAQEGSSGPCAKIKF